MKSLLYTPFVYLFLLAWPHAEATYAQAPLAQQLLPSTVNAEQDFGYSVDVYDDVAVVGAFRDEDGILLETGAAFVYRYNGSQWIEEQKIEASSRGTLNWFGWDVALSENTLLVSARNGDAFGTNGGDVAVFRYSAGSWQEEAILTPSDQVIADFGFEVALDGNVAAVGAPGYPNGAGTGGAVYVYRHNGTEWMEEDLIIGSDLSNQSLFGSAISIDGDRMLVGAFNADDSTSNQAGKLYVFEYDGTEWNETAELQSDQSNNIANLGVSVGLDGGWAIGGAQLDDELASGSGAVYVYRFDGQDWGLHSKLTASDGAGFFLFGIDTAIENNQLLVGAENWFEMGGEATGKVYLFNYDEATDQWLETTSFVPDIVNRGSQFGKAVAMHQNTMIVGAPEFSGQEDDMGTAFIYGEPSIATSIDEPATPQHFRVSSPFPNPFSNRATFTVTPDLDGTTYIGLFDLLGREVQTIFQGRLVRETSSSFVIHASNLPSGAYLLRVSGPGLMDTQSVLLTK